MLMALKRNQKGLTLIELLAVLVIVGIIAAIAIPAIGGTIAKSKSKADASSQQLVQEAALRYMVDHQGDTPAVTTVTLATLVNDGYLNATPTFNDGKNNVTISPVLNSNGSWTITVTRA
ncbi:prepilin-type N-terminal cleavage/methylation domain-containing protein [Candidatus Pristimantibacillus sp. PTI5]|uniref:prepilin-type N-terminal cleavage/methylation domain-containing protein n=1 Tax=Candidatus Pristimantibacillus sp. PTI5 TaxID=3400422 RepID=UPI003B01ABD7